MNLLQQRQIIYTPAPAEPGSEPAPELRITITSLTALQMARYEAARRAMWNWIQEETGQPAQAMRDVTESDWEFAYLRAGIQWSRAAAGISKIETRTPPAEGEASQEAGAIWQTAPLPPAWRTAAGYSNSVPAALADAIDAAIIETNPGLFFPDENADTKKNATIRAV